MDGDGGRRRTMKSTKIYPILTASDAARELGVTPPTIARWIEDGLLSEASVTGPSKWRFVTAASVAALKAQRHSQKTAQVAESGGKSS